MSTTSAHTRFRHAVEDADPEAVFACLADDVVFHSPAVHRPYRGRASVSALLRCVFDTLEDFRYTDELHADDGTATLVFRARVGDREVEGIDLLRFDDDGRIADFTVMVRPASGLMALVQAMGPKVDAAGITPADG
jgi:hypothetical protein